METVLTGRNKALCGGHAQLRDALVVVTMRDSEATTIREG